MIEALTGQSSEAELCCRHSLTAEQFSWWKRQRLENAASLFESTNKQSNEATERIAHLNNLLNQCFFDEGLENWSML